MIVIAIKLITLGLLLIAYAIAVSERKRKRNSAVPYIRYRPPRREDTLNRF